MYICCCLKKTYVYVDPIRIDCIEVNEDTIQVLSFHINTRLHLSLSIGL